MTTWTLFDQSSSTHCGHDKIFAEGNVSAHFKIHKSGLATGVETVEINNGKLSIIVLPTRGMNIWKAFYHNSNGKTENIDWKSPVRGPVHPQLVPETEASGLGWLDGFDELLARCGLESNGAPEFNKSGQVTYGLHGKISNKPAYKLELTINEDTGDIKLTGWTEETRLHFFKARIKSTLHMKFNQPSFHIEDEITNISASPTEIQMLYHANFGNPLLEEGSTLVAPLKEVVPRNNNAAKNIHDWKTYLGATTGYEEQVYFATLHANENGDSTAMLKNKSGNRAIQLNFNTNNLPCLTVWKNTTSIEDGYVTGIEPGTNYPNPRTFEGEQKRYIKLGANETTTLNLGFEYHTDTQAVEKAEAAIHKMQKEPEITHKAPLPTWCFPES